MTARSHGLLWLKEITKEDAYKTGKTGLQLAELFQAGFPVNDGFVVTSQAYFQFLNEHKLIKPIKDLLSTLNYEYPESVQQVSEHIKKKIMDIKVSDEFFQTITKTYDTLNGAFHNHPVLLHSEPTHEITNGLISPKQQLTDIHGEANVLLKIKQAWASYFDPDFLLARHKHHRDHFQDGMAIIIQKMSKSTLEGVMMTQDSLGKDKNTLIIETTGDAPDHYLLNKKPSTPEILEKHVAGNAQKISDTQLIQLAILGKKLETFCYFPQEISWVIEQDKILIKQLHPLHHQEQKNETTSLAEQLPLLLRGIPASSGLATGHVRFIKNAGDFETILHGEIIVTSHQEITHKQRIKKAAAIISDTGGRTSPIALFAREHGIPAVVGTTHATKNLKEGHLITVDGSTGTIYKGSRLLSAHTNTLHHTTATKLYLTINETNSNENDSVDGFFLAASEKPINTSLPVIYRLSDTIPDNKNVLFGYHGAAQLLSDHKQWQKELTVIRNLREQHTLHHLTILIPFIRSVQELIAMKHQLHDAGLHRSGTLHIWMDVALPSNLILLDEFIRQGLDGIALNIDTLTMLILGTEKDDSFISHAYDDLNPAVLNSIELAIKTAQKNGISSSIYGHAPSHHSSLVEKLVSWGITSMCIEPPFFHQVRKQVAEAEQSLIENA